LRLGIKFHIVSTRFFLSLMLVCLLLSGCTVVHWIPGLGPRRADATAHSVRAKGLQWSARFEPEPLRLSEHRRAAVVLALENRSKRYVRLEFPTTQRFEVTVQNARGRTLLRWSDDQPFENQPSTIGINPGELLEYRAIIATRDFAPGQRYTVSAWVVGQPGLKVELPLTPEP